MQPVSTTIAQYKPLLTMAMIIRGVIYNEITPEIQEFLDKNGITVDRAVQLKFKDGTKVSYTEKELNELDPLHRSERTGTADQTDAQADTTTGGESDHADV